jgi:hypothetical protein
MTIHAKTPTPPQTEMKDYTVILDHGADPSRHRLTTYTQRATTLENAVIMTVAEARDRFGIRGTILLAAETEFLDTF